MIKNQGIEFQVKKFKLNLNKPSKKFHNVFIELHSKSNKMECDGNTIPFVFLSKKLFNFNKICRNLCGIKKNNLKYFLFLSYFKTINYMRTLI